MRRGPAIVLTAVASGLLSVLLAVAVNVATGGSLPGPLAGLAWLAWPMVGVFAAITVGLAVYQQRIDAPADGVAPRTRAPAELPAAPVTFTGRDGDLRAAAELAGRHPVLALVGPPGVGKTSLALRFAHDRRADYPDGHLFALLRGADPEPVPAGVVLARFLNALGVPPDDKHDDLAARFRSALDGRRVLIVLDDARDAAHVRPLLPGSPGSLVVVTSRRLLGDLPGAGQHLLGALPDADAAALLTEAAGAERTAADPYGTADLVRYCAGLPLALGIAAARLRSRPAWTPGDLAARLADEHRRLDELHLGDLAVRSAFASSYAEVPAAERAVFRRAGCHPGRQFGAGDAAALAAVPEPDAAAALERLVDAHLIESPAAGRYRLHDLLRLFAAERMAAEETAADREAGQLRLLDRLAAEATAGDWMDRERDNVLAAVHRGVALGAYEKVWILAATAGPLFRKAGDHPDLLVMWSDALVAAVALGDERKRVRALCPVSSGHLQAARPARALAVAEAAVTIARRLPEPKPLAHALYVRGRALRELFRFAEAEDDLTAALDRFAAAGDAEEQIRALDSLGTLYNLVGRHAEAVTVLERALALLPPPERNEHTWTLAGLFSAYHGTGRRAEAAALNREVLELARRTDDELSYGYALRGRGWLATDDRRGADAAADMRAALAVFERIRSPGGVAESHEAIGIVAASFGRFADAVASFDIAIRMLESLGNPVAVGRTRLYRAHALAEQGRAAEASREEVAAGKLIGEVPTPDLEWVRERLSALLRG